MISKELQLPQSGKGAIAAPNTGYGACKRQSASRLCKLKQDVCWWCFLWMHSSTFRAAKMHCMLNSRLLSQSAGCVAATGCIIQHRGHGCRADRIPVKAFLSRLMMTRSMEDHCEGKVPASQTLLLI